jgi:hypothetical protein
MNGCSRPACRRRCTGLLAGLWLVVVDLPGGEEPQPVEGWWTRERKAIALNLVLDGGLVAYGFSTWGWGSSSFTTVNEGWFAADTRYGGADKLGHAYTGYLVGDVLAGVYARWGFTPEDAALLGAGSSVTFTTLMEIGDGLSAEQGFSTEDLVMNLAGAAFSWARQRVPGLAGVMDFRIEYVPSEQVTSGEDLDISTDYDGMRHLVAFKAAGVSGLHDTWVRFLELHVGYYTRGFADEDERDRRVLYGAVGVNVGQIIAELWGRTTFFDYYQVPYTYLPAEHRF